MSSQRPSIPSAVKREVRQRCGFGCVLCGCPIYDYDHIYGYDEERGHIPNEITLLCPNHHREKTNELIPFSTIKSADENPYNIRSGVSSPYGLHFTGNQAVSVIGSNLLYSRLDAANRSEFWPLVINDEKMISFRSANGLLFLNLKVYDENDLLLLRIKDNELQYSAVSWDVEFIGRKLTIREQPRQFIFQISFNAPNTILIERGRFMYEGIEISIQPDKLILPRNIIFSGNIGIGLIGIKVTAQDCRFGVNR